jgi:hypothetical protein
VAAADNAEAEGMAAADNAEVEGMAAADGVEVDDAEGVTNVAGATTGVRTGADEEGAGAGNPWLELLEDPKAFNVRVPQGIDRRSTRTLVDSIMFCSLSIF